MDSKGIYVTAPESSIESLTPEIFSSRSVSSLSKTQVSKFKKASKRFLRQKGFIPPISEEEEVVRLSDWTSASSELTCPRLFGAELTSHYRGRFSDLDRIVSQRKTKTLLPPLVSKSRTETERKCLVDITQRRSEKKAQEFEFREQSRYTKLYEEELLTMAKTAEDRLKQLIAMREGHRKTKTFLTTQLHQSEIVALGVAPPIREQRSFMKSKTLRPGDFLKFNTRRTGPPVRSTALPKEEKMRIMSEIQVNSQQAKAVDKEVSQVRTQLRAVRKTLTDHYFHLLQEGKDTRSEGLAWVVKALWRLGQLTPQELFPEFLDLMTIETILQVAEMGKELEDLAEFDNRLDSSESSRSLTPKAHPDRWNGVKERLRNLGKKERGREPLGKGEEEVRRSIELPRKSRNTRMEDRTIELKQGIEAVQKAEINRILREYCVNKLEQKLGVPMKQVLSTLVGIDVINRQMSSIAKEQKGLIDDLEKTKTYWFGGTRRKTE